MALTDPAIKNAKPKEKAFRLFDERGPYLEVRPNGSNNLRLKSRVGGKGKLLAIGV
jgi:hypothetical protein